MKDGISLNIMVTFEEIHANDRFTPEKIKINLQNINYKNFYCIYFVIDTKISSNLTENQKEDCIKIIEKLSKELKCYSKKVEHHVIDYTHVENYDQYLKDIFAETNVLADRKKYYKNSLIYVISTRLCKTKYLFHLDGNRGIWASGNDACFTQTSMNLLEADTNIVGVCVPRKKMQKRLEEYNDVCDLFLSHFQHATYHLSLQAYIVDITRFEPVVFGHMKNNKHDFGKHIEFMVDSCFKNEFVPVFLKEEYSNILKES
tara:strand:- start:3007 stop:3783 length:777 start_codon:yes stop_codon:yes gene_type:complete